MQTYPYSNYPFDKYRQFFEFKRKDYHFNVDIKSGKLLFDRKLITLKGNRLPIDLYLKYFHDFYQYHGDLVDYTYFPKGFRLNYHVYLFQEGNNFIYADKDGFFHTFSRAFNSSDLFYDTDGTGLMLRAENNGYRIFNDDDYQLFDGDGRLVKIHEQVSEVKSYEINISYDSNLKISSISDSYNHTITFDYATSHQIKIKYNNQIVFILYTDNQNRLVKIEKYTSSSEHFDEEFSFTATGITSLELASGETFDFSYSSGKISEFTANYRQNYYAFSYYPNDKKTIVHNARNVDTIYQYGEKQLVSQVQDDSENLGYLTLNKDASNYVIKSSIPQYQTISFSLVPIGHIWSRENVSVNSGADYITDSETPLYLHAKRNYVVYAQITGDLGTNSLSIEMYNSSNKLLARLIFEGKASILVAPVGLYGTDNITDSFYLKIQNNSSNTIIINRVKLVPLLGDFSVLCSNVNTSESIFNYGTNSYFFLTKGNSFSFKNGNNTVNVPGDIFAKESDYIANEKLFYKRSGNTFNFWCNDKTILISNVTKVSINISSAKSIVYDVNNETIVLQTKGSSTNLKFYRISGSEDHSFSKTEFTHHIVFGPIPSLNPPSDTYRIEKETRYVCGHETIVDKYFDKFNNLLQSKRSDGKNTINSYDSNGNLTSEALSVSTQSYQIVKTYSYDSFDNLEEEQSLVGTSLQTTSYDYDSDNNMSFIHYPNNSHAMYSYEDVSKDKMVNVVFYQNIYTAISQLINLDNDVVSEMSTSTNSYTFDYDKGDVSGVYSNNQGIVGYTYYPDIYSGHTLFDRYYTYFSNNYAFVTVYDQMGRLLRDDKLSYEYDDFSNVSEIRDDTVSSLDNNIVFTYDYYDRLTSICITDSQLRLSNSYDEYGRISSTSFKQNNNTIYSTNSYYYLVVGLEKSIQKTDINYLQNAIEVEDEPDDFSRLSSRAVSINNSHGLLYSYIYCNNSSQTNEMVNEVTYSETSNGSPTGNYEKDIYYYDSMGNITAIIRNSSSGQTPYLFNYVYDEFGRLIRENNSLLNRSFTYSYDAIGNITSKQEYYFSLDSLSNPISSRTYYYDLYCKDRLVSFGAELFTYDNYGNPLIYRDAYLSWTRGTLLQSYSKGLTEIQFDYDGFKNRRSKKKYYNNTLVSEITYDYIDGKLIRENRPNNNSILFLYSHTGIVGFVYQNNIYYYEKNIQQDVTGIRDVNNNVVTRYIYDAWGNYKVTNAIGVENTSPSFIGNINPIRYRSYYCDTDLKMYWLTSRYYDPETGRFISPDDWSYLDYKKINGLNLYAYSKNNPVMYYDPSGHLVWWAIALIVVAAIAITAVVAFAGAVGIGYISYSTKRESSDKEKQPTNAQDYLKEPYIGDGFKVYYNIITKDKNGDDIKDPSKYIIIVDESWRFSEKQIDEFLKYLKKNVNGQINTKRIKNEWMWHNIAYGLGINQDSSRRVDVYVDAPDDKWGWFFDFFRFWWN